MELSEKQLKRLFDESFYHGFHWWSTCSPGSDLEHQKVYIKNKDQVVKDLYDQFLIRLKNNNF